MTDAFGRPRTRDRTEEIAGGPAGGAVGGPASGAGSLVRRLAGRRPGWRAVLIAGGVIAAVYYGVVLFSIHHSDAGAVPLDDDGVGHPADRVTLQVQASSLDPATGSFDVQVRPVPHGDLTGELDGQLREPLQLQVTSPGQPPTTYDFPAEQVIDPVGASVSATSQARSFPFDRPQVAFWLEVLSEDRRVPSDVEMVNDTGDWELKARVREGGESGDALRIQVDAHREPLAVGMALLFIAGIALVGAITVAIVGGSLVRRQVDFDRVIWLGAMLVAIPAVRNEMPGVPPIGTAVDLFVVFPSVVIVALALLASIVVLAINEATSASDEPVPAGSASGDSE
jgi:hypothetical protein